MWSDNMIAHNATLDRDQGRKESSHPIKILHRPVIHVVPIYLSIITEISFIGK